MIDSTGDQATVAALPERELRASQLVVAGLIFRHGNPPNAKNVSTSLRLSFRATTTLPAASTPWTWNAFFARSSPMVVIVVMDGPLLVIRRQRSLYGT